MVSGSKSGMLVSYIQTQIQISINKILWQILVLQLHCCHSSVYLDYITNDIPTIMIVSMIIMLLAKLHLRIYQIEVHHRSRSGFTYFNICVYNTLQINNDSNNNINSRVYTCLSLVMVIIYPYCSFHCHRGFSSYFGNGKGGKNLISSFLCPVDCLLSSSTRLKNLGTFR